MRDLARLTLEERVGQLFFVGYQGTELTPATARIMERVRPGGIVCSQRNLESLDQIYHLNLNLQRRANLPLFLAINQEGGSVDRFRHLIAPLPSVAHLTDLGTSAVRTGARILASEIEAVGLNTNLAPVLDLGLPDSIMRVRTLAAEPAQVAHLGRVVVEELTKKKIFSCARHFPGLGGAHTDPHFALPRIERSRRKLLVEDVVPFEALSEDINMIIVSHGHYPSLGDIRPLPASLSPRVIGGLLRKTVGFEGIVITDDLTMGAVTSLGLTPKLFLRALEAGNDMFLFSQTTPLLEEAFSFIVATARNDRNLRLRIDTSIERILEHKREIEFAPVRYRPHMKSRLTRQIDKLNQSISSVEKVRVRS